MNGKPNFRPFIIPTIALAVIGWTGLYALLQYTLPTLWPRWSFYALLVIALTGTAIPLMFLYNAFLSSQPTTDASIIMRQSIWVGFYGALLGWLQMGRVLTFGLGIAIGAGLAVIEYAIRLRERALAAQKAEEEPNSQPYTRQNPPQ